MRDALGRFPPGHRENVTRPRDTEGRWQPKEDHGRPFSIVSLTDAHIPFEDKAAIREAFDYCQDLQPNIIILHELHDFYSLSRFDKDPSRIDSLQSELDQVVGYLDELRGRCPASRIILLKSNHLDRLKRYLWSQAQALSSIRALEIPALLELRQFDIEYVDCFIYQGCLFKHGNLVSKDAGMTARREMQAEGMSGVSGHTHRLSIVYHRTREASRLWIENGCLCSMDAEYLDGRVPNWQHGFSIVQFDGKTGGISAFPIAIENGKAQIGSLPI